MRSLERLSQLAQDLADELSEATTSHEEADQSLCASGSQQARSDNSLAEVARRYLRLRRERDALFPERLFADPAWDILLDLFAAGVEGRTVSISSACIAAAVPPTTALRWLTRLEEYGLVRREGDPGDHRRSLLHLAPTARISIRQWLTALGRSI